MIQELRSQLKQIKKQHNLYRKNFLQALAEEYGENNQEKAQKIIHELQAREEIKKTHHHIRHALGKGRNSSLL